MKLHSDKPRLIEFGRFQTQSRLSAKLKVLEEELRDDESAARGRVLPVT